MEKLYDGEYRLMQVLWDHAPVGSTQLVELCKTRLDWTKSTTYTVLRKLCQKGAAENASSVVRPLITQGEAIRAQGEELAEKVGGVGPFLTAFLSGRRLTPQEAQALKHLIDETMGEG